MTDIISHLTQRCSEIDLRAAKDDPTAELLKQPDEEWKLENAMIVSYYKQVQPELDSVKYEDVKAMLTYTVADSICSNNWKQFATTLGIPDSELGGIEENARIQRLKPLYVVLDEAYPKLDVFFRKNTLGHLVSTLLAMERIDVLTKIQADVQAVLSQRAASRCCTAVEPCQKSAVPQGEKADPQLNGTNVADSGVFSSGSIINDSEAAPLEAALPFASNVPSGISSADSANGESEALAVRDGCLERTDTVGCQMDVSPACDKYSAVLDAYFPKEASETMKVFVTHHEDDYEKASRLAELLQDRHSCQVLVQGDLQVAHHVDPLFYEDIVQRADAIVPIVSKTYLATYERPRFEGCADSPEASAMYEVYVHLVNRLASNGFLCHMIFPARLEEVSYAEVRHHHIFKKSVALWDNVPKLVRLMQGCKKMRSTRDPRGRVNGRRLR